MPAVDAAASTGTAALRNWLTARTADFHPAAYSAWYQALTAGFFRMKRFGLEGALQTYTGRELLQFQLMTGDPVTADALLRSAYTRLLVEDDREPLGIVAACGRIPDLVAWSESLRSIPESEVPAVLDAMASGSEELSVARVLLARRLPQIIGPSWLAEAAAHPPAIPAALARVIAQQRRDLHPGLVHVLTTTPAVLYAVEPDDLLAPLVAQASESPQTVLAPFAGAYGEATVVVAAEWHLDHQQPEAALQLAGTIRPLSRHVDRAAVVAGLAEAALGRLADALRWRDLIIDAAERRRLVVGLAQAHPAIIAIEDVLAAACECGPDQPELFFAAIRILLGARRLDLARDVCYRRQEDFIDHPVVGQVLREVLGRGAR